MLRLAIPCLLRLGFAGKRDDVGWAHPRVARTARQAIDFVVLIPAHPAILLTVTGAVHASDRQRLGHPEEG
jgi:hypothetical protein